MADEQPGPAPNTSSAAAEVPAAAEASAPAASAPGASDLDGPIYVSKREVRKNAGKGTSKKSTYFLEFFLVDNYGYETLAATGEDQGATSTPCSFLRRCNLQKLHMQITRNIKGCPISLHGFYEIGQSPDCCTMCMHNSKVIQRHIKV